MYLLPYNTYTIWPLVCSYITLLCRLVGRVPIIGSMRAHRSLIDRYRLIGWSVIVFYSLENLMSNLIDVHLGKVFCSFSRLLLGYIEFEGFLGNLHRLVSINIVTPLPILMVTVRLWTLAKLNILCLLRLNGLH